MKKLSALLILALLPASSFAGELVREATILEVANTNTNDASFGVLINGGTGVCAGSNVWIFFPASRAASAASFNQGFAAALAALAGDKKIRIHNFVDDACNGASFISISR